MELREKSTQGDIEVQDNIEVRCDDKDQGNTQVQKKTGPKRVRYIDSGRAVASFAGIIYHVAMIFCSTWVITASEQNKIYGLGVYTSYINLFRMPLFLFISGYFSISVLSRKGTKKFLHNRLMRIGIPLASTMIILNTLQSYFGSYLLKGRHSFDGWLKQLLPWSSNFNFSHAWYLYYILIFSGVLLIIDYKKIITNKIKKLGNYNPYFLDVIILILTIGTSICGLGIYKIYPMTHPLIAIIDMTMYLPFFLIGYVCYVNKNFMEQLIINIDKKRVFYFVIMIAVSMSALVLLADNFKYPSFFINLVCRYYSLLLVINLLQRFLNKENKVIDYMAKSSYGVYIFHQPVIVVVGYIYVKYYSYLPPYVGFLAVLSASIIFTYLIEWVLIKKTKVGKFLFNGA
ncbi:acyltransferase family protein [Clostridium lacusfryxellense]|uniref:acyltransferase family protein n=1 Tax=Clostridium lacusfryxellense TaxID=205328 RepID=UPI001C0B559B|nr:acyltransferase family protein [Clostridium lacusfryxellense]MBU3111440.1 acyltransferase family protein [Clostridium lacusfryxellense]